MTVERMTKHHWYIVAQSMELYIGKVREWGFAEHLSDSMRQGFTDHAQETSDLLSYVVNNKLTDRDKYGFFSEWVEW